VKLYANRPGRALTQFLGDIFAVAWAYLWVRIALRVHDTVLALAAPARKLEEAGTSLERNLHAAGSTAARVPVVGDDLRTPFDSAAGAGSTLAQAGRDQQELIADAAVTLAGVTAVVPLLITVWWLLRRLRWIRQVSAATKFATADDLSLLALRALATQPLRRLRRLSADPLEGWRAGDPDVVSALAALELARLGLRRPVSLR
jgi:hypothetical protein